MRVFGAQGVHEVLTSVPRFEQPSHTGDHHRNRRSRDQYSPGKRGGTSPQVLRAKQLQGQHGQRDGRERAIDQRCRRELTPLRDERAHGDGRPTVDGSGDRVGELLAARIARRGILGEAAVDDGGQTGRHAGGD